MNVEELKFEESLAIEMLPYIALYDKRFIKFPVEDFDTDTHSTHKRLHDTVRLRIENLKAQAIKTRKEQDEAKAAELKKFQESLDA